ncbi:MAG: hypothetical protein U9R00_01215 [Patescibacteria group bacterium]|nr:hypothetical protein [Patescibacteria group bacterium]
MNEKIILNILSYAIRAPSTHNSQPWLFKLKESGVSVFFDSKLKLNKVDKDGRDLFISIGCMLENMKIAANNLGFNAKIEFKINEEHQYIADVYFFENNNLLFDNKKLFKYIKRRVNARGSFELEKIDNDILNKIEEINSKFNNISLEIVTEKEKIKKIAFLTEKSMHYAYKDTDFRKEMSNWMNSNISRKKEGLPGHSLKMSFLMSLLIPFIVKYFNIGKILGKKNFQSISSAPLMMLFSAKDEARNWIEVGRSAQKIMLFLQSEGFQTSIYVGSIEIGNLHKKVEQYFGLKNRSQFILLAGHIKGTHRVTPRHDLSKKILKWKNQL